MKTSSILAITLLATGCGVQDPPVVGLGRGGSGGTGGSRTNATSSETSSAPTLSNGGGDLVGGTAGSNSPGAGGVSSNDEGGAAATAGMPNDTTADVFVPPPVSMVTCPQAPAGGADVHIADFESGLSILNKDGRAGVWFGYGDGTGMQTDSPIPVVASDRGGHALHVTGGGYTNWGSGIGCSFSHDFNAAVQCPYDAAAFKGVKVSVKGSGSVRLRVAQVSTTPITAVDRKGSCSSGACDDHYEVAIELTDEWTDHSYTWDKLMQPWGDPVQFDPATLLGLNFEFNSGTTYELWLDDVEFVP